MGGTRPGWWFETQMLMVEDAAVEAATLVERVPRGRGADSFEWSVILPFFNEAALLRATLAGLAAQTARAYVILVDNGSTDGSGAVATRACRELGIAYRLVHEAMPGKVNALHAGLAHVATRFVATCDADTWYPAGYLHEAERLLRQRRCVVAGAFYVAPDADDETIERAGRTMARRSRLLPRQSHTGGAGQAFRTDALRAAGGFDAKRWNYVLEDHEIIHRVTAYGDMRYSERLWCAPLPRPRDRASIRWTLTERLLYSAAAPWAGDWFFYGFLERRLHARQLTSERIREQAFQGVGKDGFAAAYAMC